MYYDPYEDERPRWWKPAAAAVAVVLILALAFAFLQLRPDSDSGDADIASSVADSGTIPEESTTSSSTSRTSISAVTTVASDAAQASDATAVTAGERPDATTVEPRTVASTTSVTSETSVPSVPSVPSAPATSPLGYPTSPDGTPLPLVVIFDVDTITISGQVPSQATKDRLAALATANSQFPDAEVIDNMVVNPAVPISVGVRVIELNSARFPEGTAAILPDHARELDRVVTIMQALPNISVVVVGHSDQRGDDLRNFAISDERARAVVNYLLYLGISPTRLSSRAAGETDLLTVGDDDAALALNRRTEFIFNGLLIE